MVWSFDDDLDAVRLSSLSVLVAFSFGGFVAVSLEKLSVWLAFSCEVFVAVCLTGLSVLTPVRLFNKLSVLSVIVALCSEMVFVTA